MSIKTSSVAALAAVAVAGSMALSSALHAQDDRFSFHGSVNAAIAKSDGLSVFGINKDGTTDYRAVSMVFGYQISSKDRVVTQLLHRRIGASPLSASEPAVGAVWAFFERKFDNGATLKLGRNPLPRGIFNEVRFVGTLLPFYRVGAPVYGETLENIDGAVLARSFNMGDSWSIDASAFGGGFDIRAVLPSQNSASQVIRLRAESSLGTQLWLNTPIDGVRFGAFVNNFQQTPRAALPEASRPGRTTTTLYSFDAVRERAFARAEYTAFESKTAAGRSHFDGWYAMAGVKPIAPLTLAVEYSGSDQLVRLPAPVESITLPVTRDLAVGMAWAINPGFVLKLEGHRQEGYAFDVGIPSIIPPTSGPPFRATLAPAGKAFYALASVAVSF